MSKILLIKCGNLTRLNYGVTPPMGIMYLASALRRQGHEVKLIDTRILTNNFNFSSYLAYFSPEIVGLSGLTVESETIHRIAKQVKEHNRGIRIIAGGPHPTAYPQETLMDRNIDAVVIGEGEKTLPELIHAMESGGDLQNVAGVYLRNNGGILRTAERPAIDDLDSLPFPAWELIDIGAYSKMFSMSLVGFRKYMGLFTSRACPYRCIYCHNMFGKSFRARSPENVLQEIEEIVHRYDITDFEVYDDIFNLNRERTNSIMELIIKRGLRINLSFPNGLRADILDRELLEKMKQAGVYYISIAVETGSERLQKYIRKNLKLNRVNEIISECARLRIFTRGFFMLGFPSETEQEIRETIKFALKSDLHTAYFFIVTPFQGTELHKMGIRGEGVPFRDYDYFAGYFNLSEVSSKKLFFYQLLAALLFNLNPRRIYLILRDFKRKKYIPYLMFWKAVDFFKAFVRGN